MLKASKAALSLLFSIVGVVILTAIVPCAAVPPPDDARLTVLRSETAEIGDVLKLLATLEKVTNEEDSHYNYYKVTVSLTHKVTPANSLRIIIRMWVLGEESAHLLDYSPPNQPPGPTSSSMTIPPALRDFFQFYRWFTSENPGAWIVEPIDRTREDLYPWTCYQVEWKTDLVINYCWHPPLEVNSLWKVAEDALAIVAEVYMFVIPTRVGACTWKKEQGEWCSLDPIPFNITELEKENRK